MLASQEFVCYNKNKASEPKEEPAGEEFIKTKLVLSTEESSEDEGEWDSGSMVYWYCLCA